MLKIRNSLLHTFSLLGIVSLMLFCFGVFIYYPRRGAETSTSKLSCLAVSNVESKHISFVLKDRTALQQILHGASNPAAIPAPQRMFDISPETGEYFAKKYNLKLDEAMTLLRWQRTGAFIDGERDQKAHKVASICQEHKLSRKAIEELIGPSGSEPQSKCIWYTYYPDHSITLLFDDSGGFVKLYLPFQK